MAALDYEYKPILTSFFTKEKTVIIPTELLQRAIFVVTSDEKKSILEIKTYQNTVTLEIPDTSPCVIKDVIDNFFQDLHAW